MSVLGSLSNFMSIFLQFLRCIPNETSTHHITLHVSPTFRVVSHAPVAIITKACVLCEVRDGKTNTFKYRSQAIKITTQQSDGGSPVVRETVDFMTKKN